MIHAFFAFVLATIFILYTWYQKYQSLLTFCLHIVKTLLCLTAMTAWWDLLTSAGMGWQWALATFSTISSFACFLCKDLNISNNNLCRVSKDNSALMMQTYIHHVIGTLGCIGSYICGYHVTSVCVRHIETAKTAYSKIDGNSNFRNFDTSGEPESASCDP